MQARVHSAKSTIILFVVAQCKRDCRCSGVYAKIVVWSWSLLKSRLFQVLKEALLRRARRAFVGPSSFPLPLLSPRRMCRDPLKKLDAPRCSSAAKYPASSTSQLWNVRSLYLSQHPEIYLLVHSSALCIRETTIGTKRIEQHWHYVRLSHVRFNLSRIHIGPATGLLKIASQLSTS